MRLYIFSTWRHIVAIFLPESFQLLHRHLFTLMVSIWSHLVFNVINITITRFNVYTWNLQAIQCMLLMIIEIGIRLWHQYSIRFCGSFIKCTVLNNIVNIRSISTNTLRSILSVSKCREKGILFTVLLSTVYIYDIVCLI